MPRLLPRVLLLVWLPFSGMHAEEVSPAPRNLILISIDTLRPDRLGCYGHDRATSPAIDRLSAGGARFETALATSPWTKPSHASMLTGRYPSRHGAASMAAVLDKRAITLASMLSARGFQTTALVNASWLSRDGLERGFDEMHWTKYIQGKRPGSGMAQVAIDWLEKRAAVPARNSERFFLFLHMMDVHSDYASTERYESMFTDNYKGSIDGTTQQLYRHLLGEITIDTAAADHLRSLYDAGIRQLDDSLGRLFTALEKQGRIEDTLIVLTSDDRREWTLRHDNQGKHFGGVGSGKPLTLAFSALAEHGAVEARYVRIQVRSATPVFFHLDEVEVYGRDDPQENIALKRPARQSSLSQWSRGNENRSGCLLPRLGISCGSRPSKNKEAFTP